MTQHQIALNLWVGDDQYNGEDYDYVIDLRDWYAEKTFVEKDYQYIDGVVEDIKIGLTHGRTLIHCHAGIDRSPFAVAMYLHVHHGKAPFEAYDIVQKRRKQTIVHGEWVFPYVEYLGTMSDHMKMLLSCRKTKEAK